MSARIRCRRVPAVVLRGNRLRRNTGYLVVCRSRELRTPRAARDERVMSEPGVDRYRSRVGGGGGGDGDHNDARACTGNHR